MTEPANTAHLNLGLVGYPLGHSLSPQIHKAALDSLGIAGEYSLYPTPPTPEGNEELEELLGKMRRGEIHGLNVTIPHKQTVLRWLDDLTSTAKITGAVNTIFLRGGASPEHQIMGANTDAEGFHRDLGTHLRSARPVEALVLGAGGSARAVVYALLSEGWHVTVAARRPEQAEELLENFQRTEIITPPGTKALRLEVLRFDHRELAGYTRRSSPPSPSLIVNTTPLGMAPEVNASPWPDDLPLPGGAFVYDLVYNPPETRLIRTARQQGLAAANGLGMLVEQAALAFERWTAKPAPRQVMVDAAVEALAKSHAN